MTGLHLTRRSGAGVWFVRTVFCIWLAVTGCAHTTSGPEDRVLPGETVAVDYTCRLPDNTILATTLPAVDRDNNQPKAGAYLPIEKRGPATVTAGAPGSAEEARMAARQPILLETAIGRGLSPLLAGLAKGRTHHLTLTADIVPGIPPGSRFLKMARVRLRPKQRRYPLKAYIAYTGLQPHVGDTTDYDQVFTETVLAVTETEVVSQLAVKAGATYDTPFGSGTVEDRGDRYAIVLRTDVGDLVGTGGIIGRIISVNDRHFTVDFGHPLGGRTLSCEVTVRHKKSQ